MRTSGERTVGRRTDVGTRVASLALRVRRRLLPPHRRPLLSVVIPTFNVAAYVEECLSSILSQTLGDLEVIVVDDGSTDQTPAIARAAAQRDPRVHVLAQAHAGQGVARNRGVAFAIGRYLVFADGDDVVPEDAYERMLATAEQTGSDFVLGPVMRLKAGNRLSPPGWQATVFERERRGVSIEEFPLAMFDVLACNRLLRRRFWVRQVGGFPGGIVYEDHVPMVRAFLRAKAFDVLTEPVYHWRVRADATSTRQQKHEVRNLRDRLAVKQEAWSLVEAEASPPVRSAWLARVLDLDLASYLRPALAADEEYRRLLATGFAQYLGMADGVALDQVRVVFRMADRLAADGRWDLVEGLLRRADASAGELPTELAEDGLHVASSVLSRLGIALPRRFSRVGGEESRLKVCLSDLRWAADNLEIEGWAVVPFLDTTMVSAEVRAWLVDPGDPRGEIPLIVEPRCTPAATQWSKARYARSDGGGFRLAIDVSRLASPSEPGSRHWEVRFALRAGPVHREATALFALSGSLAALEHLPHHVRPGERSEPAVEYRPDFDREHGFVLRSRPLARQSPEPETPTPSAALAAVTSAEIADDRLVVTLSGAEATTDPGAPAGALAGPLASVPAASSPARGEVGRWSFERWSFELWTERFGQRVPLPAGTYGIIDAAGDRLAWAGEGKASALPVVGSTHHHQVQIESSGAGAVRIRLSVPLASDERSAVDQQRLRDRYHDGGPGDLDDGVMIIGTDSGSRPDLVALSDELLAQGRTVLSWELRDPGLLGPEGTHAVAYRSARWHELLATSRFLLCGRSVPSWLGTVPGQERLSVELGRPRLVALRRADPERVRERVRRRLGIDLEEFVVLTGALRRREVQRLTGGQGRTQPRVLVAAGDWTRLPALPGIIDATGWLRPWELLIAADEVDLDRPELSGILGVPPTVLSAARRHAARSSRSAESTGRWPASELRDAMLEASGPEDASRSLADLLPESLR
jgi:glycosyltransferase involved in cell wall biosynthesis